MSLSSSSPPSTEPITISLPVCPRCGRTDQIPGSSYGGKSYCVGPKGSQHSRVKMAYREFREVVEEQPK